MSVLLSPQPDTWDSGFWDSGFWDATSQGTTPGPMVKVKTDISKRKPVDQIAKMRAGHQGLLDNAAVFANPTVPLAQFNTEINTAQGFMDDITTQEGILTGLRTQRDNALRIARGSYTLNGSFVETKSGNDRAKAALSGYDLTAETPAPAPALYKLTGVALTSGDDAGEADGMCNADPTADGYEVQVSPDPPGAWTMYGSFGNSKFTLTGLPSLTKQWMRVRAMRGNDKGPWSDPAFAVIP